MSKKQTQIKRAKKSKYIKDKALIHFINQHSRKEAIDFSKIKIPSFLDLKNNKDDEFKNIVQKIKKNSEIPKVQNRKGLPNFTFSLLSFLERNEEEQNIPKFNSSMFK